MAKSTEPLSQRIFRTLLRALPFDFRINYQGEMEGVFRQQQREVEETRRRAGSAEAVERNHRRYFHHGSAGTLADPDQRLWLRAARDAQEFLVLGDRYSYAGTWDWRERCYFQRSSRRAPSAASLPEPAAVDFHPPARKKIGVDDLAFSVRRSETTGPRTALWPP